MNPIVLAPTSLARAEPLEFIDAAAKAGYDGVGLRLFASPGVGYPVFHDVAGNAKLRADVKSALKDSGLKVYDVLSYYMQPEMDFDAMLPSLELAAELGADYALAIGDDPELEPAGGRTSRRSATMRLNTASSLRSRRR